MAHELEHSHPPSPLITEISYKRQRRQSPQPERGEKRVRVDSNADQPNRVTSTSKRWKADPEGLPPIAKLNSTRTQPPKPKPISTRPASDSNLPNFVPGPAGQTEYAEQVSLADELREAGNTAYQEKKYQDAIELYTVASQAYPLQPLPDRPAHPGFTTSLANRASAHMALNDHRAAADDLRQSMKSTILPPFLPDSLRTTLARRILRLAKCYLALLEPQPAADALEHVSKPSAPVFLAHTNPLWQEMSIAFLRTNKLATAVKVVELERDQKRWKETSEAIEAVENLAKTWAYRHPSLPGRWLCWKAEAQVWLGEPTAAEETLSLYTQSTLPDEELEHEHLRVQGLVHMAQAKFDSAITFFSEAITGNEDPPLRKMLDRAQVLKEQWQRIERLVAVGPTSQNHTVVIRLASTCLVGSEGPIERLIRIKLLVTICEARLKVSLLQPRPLVELEYAKVLVETGFNFERRCELRPEYRPFVIRVLLCRARTTHAQADYRLLATLLRVDNWGAGMTIDLAAVYQEIDRHERPRPVPLPSRSAFCKLTPRDPKGYYAILQVSHLAQPAELKRSYRALCRTCHPDKGGQTAAFQQIQEAFEILSDPIKRRAYDYGHQR
ncbi:hypothetical protein CROQUDRAFT_47576 [Cronartium quercuum f. sp. fusiforme G11]|uniref:J domain-containing protein n=1 Tax=Cronartium quercuum f. sp. fusiforme G11 TaxID=708437 RepID=A0A9P6TA45_9BASI|nr:hypothetical protein CROQUDRAFT_47576 [Cronartium quercuum f. sp. fusiforme G11]